MGIILWKRRYWCSLSKVIQLEGELAFQFTKGPQACALNHYSTNCFYFIVIILFYVLILGSLLSEREKGERKGKRETLIGCFSYALGPGIVPTV